MTQETASRSPVIGKLNNTSSIISNLQPNSGLAIYGEWHNINFEIFHTIRAENQASSGDVCERLFDLLKRKDDTFDQKKKKEKLVTFPRLLWYKYIKAP